MSGGAGPDHGLETERDANLAGGGKPKRKSKGRKSKAKLNFRTGEFEKTTIKELKKMYQQHSISEEEEKEESAPVYPPGLERAGSELCCFYDIDGTMGKDDEEGKDGALNMAWRSEPEEWNKERWVKVKSIMDSGASAPVAPPDMLPNVKIRESPGSKRGQKFSSASKHKLKNLGEQQIHACTEEGDDMEILFQIADISKPLVSISSICERGNRVLFGRVGGVVINNKTGAQIPFYKENGVYVLTMWMKDADSDFGRR